MGIAIGSFISYTAFLGEWKTAGKQKKELVTWGLISALVFLIIFPRKSREIIG